MIHTDRIGHIVLKVFGGMVVSLLTRRLEIEHWYTEHPEIDDQEIASVLFGVGLPRTGSTALRTVTALVRRMRCVRRAAAARMTAGAESRYSRRWCSPMPNTSRPT